MVYGDGGQPAISTLYRSLSSGGLPRIPPVIAQDPNAMMSFGSGMASYALSRTSFIPDVSIPMITMASACLGVLTKSVCVVLRRKYAEELRITGTAGPCIQRKDMKRSSEHFITRFYREYILTARWLHIGQAPAAEYTSFLNPPVWSYGLYGAVRRITTAKTRRPFGWICRFRKWKFLRFYTLLYAVDKPELTHSIITAISDIQIPKLSQLKWKSVKIFPIIDLRKASILRREGDDICTSSISPSFIFT